LYFNAGSGSFAPAVTLPNARAAVMVALGDADGDGWLDIFTAAREATVSVSRNKRDRSFAAAVDTDLSVMHSTMVVADFDGDGNSDAAFGSNRPGLAVRVSVFPGRGDGQFDPPAGYVGIANGLAAADLDKDGRPDLAAATRTGVIVLLNRSH
jgi:hypothetical protein